MANVSGKNWDPKGKWQFTQLPIRQVYITDDVCYKYFVECVVLTVDYSVIQL